MSNIELDLAQQERASDVGAGLAALGGASNHRGVWR